jgi:hypothetical protein
MIYRTIKEAKRKENDRYIGSAKNKTREMWRIINKELEVTQKGSGKGNKMWDMERV